MRTYKRLLFNNTDSLRIFRVRKECIQTKDKKKETPEFKIASHPNNLKMCTKTKIWPLTAAVSTETPHLKWPLKSFPNEDPVKHPTEADNTTTVIRLKKTMDSQVIEERRYLQKVHLSPRQIKTKLTNIE